MGKISAALEDYLEAILRLREAKGAARVGDLAAALSVHKSTVSAALHSLARKGLAHYTPYEAVTLTSKGAAVAREVSLKHGGIRRFLRQILLLDEDAAEENACRMEHGVDAKVMERLILFERFIASRPNMAKDMRQFRSYVRRAALRKDEP